MAAGERHVVNTKRDTSCVVLVGPGVEETVTMVGPSLRLGSARHWRAHRGGCALWLRWARQQG